MCSSQGERQPAPLAGVPRKGASVGTPLRMHRYDLIVVRHERVAVLRASGILTRLFFVLRRPSLAFYVTRVRGNRIAIPLRLRSLRRGWSFCDVSLSGILLDRRTVTHSGEGSLLSKPPFSAEDCWPSGVHASESRLASNR
jgi:hypothetical protein